MKLSDIPAKQAVPFGVNGQREALLPTTPAGDNKASYNNGFPPVTMILKSAGGVPPKGQDMNQILFELSSLCRWFSAGGAIKFDSDFCTAIGGYPIGSYIMGDDNKTVYRCTKDDNTNNPNSSSTGWVTAASDIASILQLKNAAYCDIGTTSGTVAAGDDPRFKYGSPLVGQLIEWPFSSMPQEIWPDCGMEFIPWMGQQFDPVKYPLAHQLWPSDRLPVDMRGEFVRGWDNGRGVDPGRDLLSSQSDSVKRHRHATAFTTSISDSKYPSGAATIVVSGDSSSVSFVSNDLTSTRYVGTFDGFVEGQTQDESRPRSVAWNMIVRVK